MIKPKSFPEFFQDRYKNSKYPVITLPISLLRKIGIQNILKDDIIAYQKYLQRIEELQTVPKYAL